MSQAIDRIGSRAARLPGLLTCVNFWLVSLFLIGWGIMFVVIPKVGDDFWFIHQLRKWFISQDIFWPESGGNIFRGEGLLKGILGVWRCHYEEDNIRLGNMIAPLLLIFPKWFGGGLSVIMLAWLMRGMYRYAGLCVRHSALVGLSLIPLSYMLGFNFFSSMLDYQLNYVWPSALALWLMNILRKEKQSPRARLAGILLLSLVVGMWHEGFSVPLCAGLVITCVFYKECRNIRVLISILGLAVGSGVLWLAPGARHRASCTVLTDYNMAFWLGLCLTAMFMIAAVVLTLNLIRKYRVSGILGNPTVVFLISGSLVSLALVSRTGITYRGGWWCMLASSLCILWLLQKYYNRFWGRYDWKNSVILAPFLIFIFLQLGVGDVYSFRFRAMIKDYIGKYEKAPGEVVFGKVYEMHQLPPIMFYTPFPHFPNEYLFGLNVYFRWPERGWAGLDYVVPEQLKYVTATAGEPVPGNSEIRRYKDYLFAPCWDNMGYEMTFYADFGSGPRLKLGRAYKFRSHADGKEYYYIQLFTNRIEGHFLKLKSIDGPLQIIQLENGFANDTINFYD